LRDLIKSRILSIILGEKVMKLILENWRKFVKESMSAGEGDVIHSRDIVELGAAGYGIIRVTNNWGSKFGIKDLISGQRLDVIAAEIEEDGGAQIRQAMEYPVRGQIIEYIAPWGRYELALKKYGPVRGDAPDAIPIPNGIFTLDENRSEVDIDINGEDYGDVEQVDVWFDNQSGEPIEVFNNGDVIDPRPGSAFIAHNDQERFSANVGEQRFSVKDPRNQFGEEQQITLEAGTTYGFIVDDQLNLTPRVGGPA
jgi:hypothetical protein